MQWNRRQRSLRAAMQQAEWSAMLVTHLPNVRYLCGFTGSAGVLALTRRHSAFFTDGRYRQQAAQEVAAERLVTDGPPLKNAVAWLARQHPGITAFEGAHLSARDFALVR